MLLVDGQVVGASIDLPGAGEDDSHVRIVLAARLEHGELRPAVHLQVLLREAHGVDVAGLPGQAEEVVLPANELSHPLFVARVRQLDGDLITDVRDIEQPPAVLGHQAVDEEHLGLELHEPSRQVGADEAEPSRDEDATVLEVAISRHPGPPRERKESRWSLAGS